MDSPATLAGLEQIDALRAQLDAMRPLDADRLGAAVQRLRIEWTYHSNAIEGNSLTYGETRALLMHGVTADGKPLKDHLDIQGHREALDYLEQVVQRDEPLTLAAVREMHGLLLGEPYETWAETPDGQRVRRTIAPGEFKTMPNHVRTETGETHYYARPEEVPAQMQDLVDIVQGGPAEGTHPVVFASDVHHRFAAIHPFDDGNGRMARLLMNLVLMRAGYPPAVLRQENRPAYYGALAAVDGGDLDRLVRFVAAELDATMELYLRALRGEPDPDLFSRRLGLLKREMETRSEARQSPEALSQISSQFVAPLLNRLDAGLREMASLFNGLDSVTAYTDRTGLQVFPGDALPSVLSTVEWISFYWNRTLKGHLQDPALNLPLTVEGSVETDHVAITTSQPSQTIRVWYALIPGEQEAIQLADQVLLHTLGQAEAISRNAQAGDS